MNRFPENVTGGERDRSLNREPPRWKRSTETQRTPESVRHFDRGPTSQQGESKVKRKGRNSDSEQHASKLQKEINMYMTAKHRATQKVRRIQASQNTKILGDETDQIMEKVIGAIFRI